MATALKRPPKRMTFEEYLDWVDVENLAEWVNGEIDYMCPVVRAHSEVTSFLLTLLNLFVQSHQLGQVFGEPFLMKIASRRTSAGRMPDIFFVATENLPRVQENFMDGPADLAVEVISPESRVRDRQTKFVEYQRAGVREYWLLDPKRSEAFFYQLQADGEYRLAPVDANGIYHSAVLEGLWIDVNWLWQRPLPLPLDIIRQWGLI